MARFDIDSFVRWLGILVLFHMLIAAPVEAAKFPKPVFAEEFGTVT